MTFGPRKWVFLRIWHRCRNKRNPIFVTLWMVVGVRANVPFSASSEHPPPRETQKASMRCRKQAAAGLCRLMLRALVVFCLQVCEEVD